MFRECIPPFVGRIYEGRTESHEQQFFVKYVVRSSSKVS